MLPLRIRLYIFWEQHGGSHLFVPEVVRLLVEAALTRQDEQAAEMHFRDWQEKVHVPTTRISKFEPGAHFHVLGLKFNSQDEAQRYAKSRGYRVLPDMFVEASPEP